MRDFAAKWRPLPNYKAARLEGDNLSAKMAVGLYQTLVSGDIGLALPGHGVEPVGWGPVVGSDPYAVRIARDRMLLISNQAIPLQPGWHDGGYAVSCADNLYTVFELSGTQCQTVFAEGTSLAWDSRSASAAMLLAKVRAFVYRHQNEHSLRIHVESPYATYFWTWLERMVD